MPVAADSGMCIDAARPHPACDSSRGHNASRSALQAIRSFGDASTERFWSRQRTRRLDPRIQRTALRKLVVLDAALVLDDLKVPPEPARSAKGLPHRAAQHPHQPAVAYLLRLDPSRR